MLEVAEINATSLLCICKGGDPIKRYRNEWKYCEDERELTTLRERLRNLLEHDPYAGADGKYEIHSLYFDDYKDTCARENVAGEGKRFKYRIRYYGSNLEDIWLEKKEKLNSYCHKRKCRITAEEVELIIQGKAMEVFWNTGERLLKEFCTDIVTKRFLPRVIIDYEREAFVELITNVRITLDNNITASDEIEEFLTGDYLKVPILEKKKHVLEVKFDDILPSHIRQVIQSNIFIQRSFSKYYLGRVAVQEKNKFNKVM